MLINLTQKLQEAAHNVTNLNEMAAQDDYIHHNEMNTPQRMKAERGDVKREARAPPGERRGSWNVVEAPPPKSSRLQPAAPPLLNAVQQVLRQTPSRDSSFNSQHSDMSDDDSATSSDDEDDFILQQVRQETAGDRREKDWRKRPQQRQSKDRFSKSLEERVSLVNDGPDMQDRRAVPLADSSPPPRKWAFWRTSAATKSTPSRTQPASTPPLSRSKSNREKKMTKEPDSFDTVTSTAMLSADDLLALQQLSQAPRASRRHVFVVISLLLSLVVYFLMRHWSPAALPGRRRLRRT